MFWVTFQVLQLYILVLYSFFWFAYVTKPILLIGEQKKHLRGKAL